VTGPLTSIPVGSGDDAHEVVVGHGVVDAVVPLLGESVQRVLVVHPPTLAVWAQQVADTARAAGLDAYLAVVPDAEEAKSAVVAAELWGALGQAGFTRTDAVVGVGGGTVTDLAGFVAATWLRGVRVVQVPTTLLAMVDAAVGGKTGINTAEGKNLVGSFHPPAGVLCDLDALSTLPRPDLVAGMAEIVKCGFIADPRILELVEADPVAALDVEGPFLRQLVERAIQVKADVVTADLREIALREILNYGHTFGHAVEQVEGYRWRHGEAVSVGMTFAAELGRLSGHLAPPLVDRHRAVLTSLGLPVSYAPDRWDELVTAMRRDKKSRGSRLRFVVLDDIAAPVRLEGPPDAMLRDAYACVSG
jgi:3-dehydroquinate synthase